MKTKFKAFFVFLCLKGFLAFSQSGRTDSLLPLKQRWISVAGPEQKISALQTIITGYSQNLSQKDSLLRYCNTYINYAREIKSDTTLMRAYLARLKAFRFHSDWISLINSGKEALHELEKSKQPDRPYYKSVITDEMVYGYIFLQDQETVNILLDARIADLEKLNRKGKYDALLAQHYLTKARANGHLGNYNTANVLLDSALHYFQKSGDELSVHYTYNDIISNHIEQKSGVEVLPMALKCFHFFKKIPKDRGLAEIEMLLGRIYLNSKEFSSSVGYSLESIRKTENPRILYHCFDNLYQSYKALGQNKEALGALEQYHLHLNKLNDSRLVTENRMLEKRIAEQQAERQLNSEKEKVATQTRYKNYILIGAFLILCATITLYLSRKLVLKQKKAIEDQKQIIQELNADLEKKVAIRTAELQGALDEIKEAMQRGQTLERKRMAADLHDNLGSLLTAIHVSLENINHENFSEREKRIYENVVSMTENAYSEIRNLSHNLMPEVLEKEGLRGALELLVKKLNLNQNVAFSLKLSLESPPNKVISLNLYAICLELVQNIIKHAHATQATISVFEMQDQLILEMSDNGKGLPPDLVKGFGFRNIEERLNSINGQLSVERKDGKGTKISIQIPFIPDPPPQYSTSL